MKNLTLGIAPSLDDLILLPHRASERVKQLAYYYGLDDIFGRIKGSGAFIAENTGNRSNVSASLTKKAFARETLAAVASSIGGSGAPNNLAGGASPGAGLGQAAVTGVGGAFSQGITDSGFARFMSSMWHAWKSLGGVLPYIMSKWAFLTLLMVRPFPSLDCEKNHLTFCAELPCQSNPILRFLTRSAYLVVASQTWLIPSSDRRCLRTNSMASRRHKVSDFARLCYDEVRQR